jgi:hypothetical protein
MDNKTQPLEIYIATNINNHGGEEEYTLEEEIDYNQGQQWGEEAVVVESLLHIAKTTIHQTTLKDHHTNRL